MRLTTLGAITLALSLCGTAAAQAGTLVERDTANDACKTFKLRILMPADVGTKLRLESPASSLDPGIVWNPCEEDSIHFAVVPFSSKPDSGTSTAVRTFRLLPPATKSDLRAPFTPKH